MPATTLADLLERNASHASSLPAGYFTTVEEAQEPAAVSVCCSDSRVSQEGMWSIESPGWLFTPSTIGNQVWDLVDGELVVDGSVLYPILYTNTRVTVVVGHTGCGAITAALASVNGEEGSHPPGIAKWVNLLETVVERGLERDDINPSSEHLIDQLVEFNVDRQVSFLRESDAVPSEEIIYGFVYDFQGTYGETPGIAYLVNLDGVTDVKAIRDSVPERFSSHVRRLT